MFEQRKYNKSIYSYLIAAPCDRDTFVIVC